MRLTLSTLFAIVLAAALFAQVPQKQQPTFRGGVNLVRVDVYPTIDGRAVGDLTRDDFEVREDGVAQRIETFERIVARELRPEAERAEPASHDEANAAAGDPRTRLFVVFFDTLHAAGYEGSDDVTYDQRSVGVALSAFLGKLIGADDLVGLMVPEMRAESIVFTRRPASFQQFLESGADFQRRFFSRELDDTERRYETCYPPKAREVGDFAARMIARRRETLLIGALTNLVAHLNTLREGRKAVLLVSPGWTLFTPDPDLARPRHQGVIPMAPPIGVDKGQPTLKDPSEGNAPMAACERDRLMLAGIDNQVEFRAMLNEANRANVTFYPIDPGGLRVTSSMNRRADSLRTLATATDGLPIVDSNDFAPGLKRVADDLSSYYLLGYYSTNGKADGSFRKISVTVRRPKVAVRARRGYTAPTRDEAVEPVRTEADDDPTAAPRAQTLAALGAIRADRPVHMSAGYGWRSEGNGSPPSPRMWISADVDFQAWRRMPWSSGADISVSVLSGEQVLATTAAEMPALSPRVLLWMTDLRLAPGSYDVRIKAQPKLGSAEELTATAHVEVPKPATEGGLLAAPPLIFRRGPFTGSGFQPTADPRFRKSERLRADVPVSLAVTAVTARLLDRKGQALPVPVSATPREEGGYTFASAEITLAPLAQGDYLLELSAAIGERSEKKLVAFRIVP
ncbi:MAG: VWA domain-containing protein [Bacteroidales bacterium]